MVNLHTIQRSKTVYPWYWALSILDRTPAFGLQIEDPAIIAGLPLLVSILCIPASRTSDREGAFAMYDLQATAC